MSEYTAARAGLAAVEAKEWDEAIAKLTYALTASRSPKWLIARSKAYIGKGDFARALRDAEFAYAAASSRGSRDLIMDAQNRRAVAYYRLGRYADADACATWVQLLVEGKGWSDPAVRDPVVDERGFAQTKRAQVTEMMQAINTAQKQANNTELDSRTPPAWNKACALRLQILGQLDKLAEDDERRKVMVKFAPDVSLDDFAAGEDYVAEEKKNDASKDGETDREDKEDLEDAAAASVRNQPQAQDARVDFYQSSAIVTVSIFAKNVPKDEFKVEYGSQEIRMTHIPGHEPWYTIPLWGQIDPSGSKHTVTANKVEFQLKKLAGKWPTLRGDPAKAQATPAALAPAPAPAATKASAPAYPTSSKSGPKDWDKIAGDDDEEEKDINVFFKKLYKDATPEQQRAMMKSFTESNGTALSTDWSDVKDRKVETQPPEGVEAKKWES